MGVSPAEINILMISKRCETAYHLPAGMYYPDRGDPLRPPDISIHGMGLGYRGILLSYFIPD
jgi:hypothetical protein